MRHFSSLMMALALVGLAACGDDDPAVEPAPLNLLTRITCAQEGQANTVFSATVDYNTDGTLSGIDFAGNTRRAFIQSDDKFLVTETRTGFKEAEYTLSGGMIARQEVFKENEKVANEIYVSDTYDYQYTGSSLTAIGWTTRWPRESGEGYEERVYPLSDIFTWEGGNVTRYTRDKEEMAYVYGPLTRPENFPLRPLATFDLLGFDFVSPINLLYGTLNRQLPERAYSYSVLDPGTYRQEYRFSYTFMGSYITAMDVEVTGGARYHYTFEYNYTPGR